MKKKTIISILSIICLQVLYSQETVGSAGKDLSNSQTKLNFTIGEPIINTLSNDKETVLIGYQQPIIKVEPISIKEGQDWNISIFPNPSTNYINIEWKNETITEMYYSLLDINGKIVLQGNDANNIQLNVTDISSGNYFLHLKTKRQSQIYKIQKIQ